jgi:hypothetical protein
MTTTMLERGPDLWSHRQEGKESVLDTIQKTLDTAVQDDPANGIYRVSREIFTDPEIFELEMKHILRGQLDLSGAREPDPEQERLFHDLYRPSADLHRAQS